WYVNEKNHKLSAFVNSSKWRQIDDNKFVRKVKFTMSREFNAIIVIESIGEKAFFTNVMLSNETYNFNYISNKLNDFITAKKISFLLNSFLLGLPKKRGWELINSDNYAYRFVLVRNLHKFKVVKSSRHIGKWWLR
ncbi:MAG: hypothetical protein ORO03_05990, partial [Alphaproteobacteria bacterium]|nr:hypothetical protein [Alphaproteobacteria bacterium]